MKLLVISDTHGETNYVMQVLLPKYAGKIDMLVHLGDYVEDAELIRRAHPAIPIAFVAGAYEHFGKTRQVLTIGKTARRVLIMHGHDIGVKQGLSRISHFAQQQGVHACFFGHTHQPIVFSQGGVFFINPGSVTDPRGLPRCSYGLVTILPCGTFEGEIVYI